MPTENQRLITVSNGYTAKQSVVVVTSVGEALM
jgi:uncharacterized protein YegP (UPF0339 family)